MKKKKKCFTPAQSTNAQKIQIEIDYKARWLAVQLQWRQVIGSRQYTSFLTSDLYLLY